MNARFLLFLILIPSFAFANLSKQHLNGLELTEVSLESEYSESSNDHDASLDAILAKLIASEFLQLVCFEIKMRLENSSTGAPIGSHPHQNHFVSEFSLNPIYQPHAPPYLS